MAAGRESKDADTLWIDVPFSGPCSHSTNRARRILQWRRMMVSRSKPILEHERSNTQSVEPFRDWPPFVIGQMAIAATRTNDHRCAGGLFFRSEVRRQRGNVDGFLAD